MTKMFGDYDRRIRSHILIDALEKIPIDKSFNNLCKEIGKGAIASYDFQYWYYRFLSGKLDLDFDRSTEPEPFQFSDLPLDAVGWIVDYLYLEERLVLKHVSKPLKDFIERQDSDFEWLSVTCGADLISLAVNDVDVLYVKNDMTREEKWKRNISSRTPVVIVKNYESEAFNDLAWILKNPKLQLESFSFDYGNTFGNKNEVKSEEQENKNAERCCKRMENVLKSLTHQVVVEHLTIDAVSPDNLLVVLPYLKPGHLKKIEIHRSDFFSCWKNAEDAQKIQKFVSLDQWKQANYLQLDYLLEFFPDNAFTNFNSLVFREQKFQSGVLIRLKDIVINSETLESCVYNFNEDFEREDWQIGIPAPRNEDDYTVRHFMIRNSNQYVEFRFLYHGRGVEVVKKTHQ